MCFPYFHAGNTPADILSNITLNFDGFHWWDHAIPEIRASVFEDRVGRAKYGFCRV
ncbi:hypothetical protein LguiB_020907 [Lonicera macranthoides]